MPLKAPASPASAGPGIATSSLLIRGDLDIHPHSERFRLCISGYPTQFNRLGGPGVGFASLQRPPLHLAPASSISPSVNSHRVTTLSRSRRRLCLLKRRLHGPSPPRIHLFGSSFSAGDSSPIPTVRGSGFASAVTPALSPRARLLSHKQGSRSQAVPRSSTARSRARPSEALPH